jgi:hypothetical protein
MRTLHAAGLLGSGNSLSPGKKAIQMIPEFRAAAESLQKQLEGKPKDDRKKILADLKVSDPDLYKAYVALANEGSTERRRQIDQKMGEVYQIREFSEGFHAAISDTLDKRGSEAMQKIQRLLPKGSPPNHHGGHHGHHRKSA